MWIVNESQWQNPSFAEQGVDLDRVFFELGLVNDVFYDTIVPAEADRIDAYRAWWGRELPSAYTAFLHLAGASLGTLRICDWRTTWDFRPAKVLTHAEARTDRDRLRAAQTLPIAVIGEAMDFGYDGDVCLFLDVETGCVFPEDDSRHAYEDLTSFFLEWGHRLLDPIMATPLSRLRRWSSTGLSHQEIAEVHELCAPHSVSSHVGRSLGVYRYARSGILLHMDRADTLWVEAYRHQKVAPERTAAMTVMQQGQELGWFQD